MNYTPSGYPSSFQGLDLSKYETTGQPSHNYEHLPQIERMIQDFVAANVPQMIDEVVERKCGEMVRAMIGAIQYDVRTCVDLSFDDAGDIFHSERARKYVSDRISQAIISRLKDTEIEWKF